VQCPLCHSQNIKTSERWRISDLNLTRPPRPMWVCLEPTCLHEWPRQPQVIESAAR